MNADLVNILSWQRPDKSAVALFAVNVVYWFLAYQRPIFIAALILLFYYVKYLWTHRICPEVLVDPPDHEAWVTLSTYDMKHASLNFLKGLWKFYIGLHSENHFVWTLLSITLCLIFAKFGTYCSLSSLVFIILNGAFVVVPLLSYIPKDTVERINDFFPPPSDEPIHFREQSMGPDSLALESEQIPSYSQFCAEESELEDEEFMFNPKHFDSSSSKSSSASGSFEVI